MRLLLMAACTVATFAVGCGQNPPQVAQKADAPAEHDHHGAGPHGRTDTDWGGGKYHVEFTGDHDKKEATIYILGSDEKSPAPVKASKLLLSINEPSFQVDLIPQPLAGKVEGSSSRFVGQHDNLGKVQEFAGTISGEVDGTPFAGDFKEQAEGHDHKH
jgi:hypothetical protein